MKKLLIINIFFLLFAASTSAQHDALLTNKAALAKKYEQAGELEKAKQLYNDILKEQPWNFEILRSLNDVFLRLKEYDNSIILIREKINLNPGDPNLYGLLGSTYATMGDNGKASEIWDKGIEVNKTSMVTYRVIADYAIQKRAFDKAIDILKKGRQVIKDPMVFSYDLGNLYSVTMEFKDAAEVYCELLLTNPEQIGSVQNRMNRYLTHPNSSKPTIETVESYYEKYNKPVYLDLLGYLYMHKQNYAKALDVIIQKDKTTENNGISILNFARTAFGDGDYQTSAKAYQFVIDNYNSASFIPDAKLGYVRALEEKLNRENYDSLTSWNQYYKIDTSGAYKYSPIINEYENIAQTYFKDNIVASAKFRIGIIKQEKFFNFDEAEKIYTELYKSRIGAVLISELIERLANIAIQKNDLEKALAYYKRLNEIPASDPAKKSFAKYMSAKIFFWQGNFPSALKNLQPLTADLTDDFANDAIEQSIIINTLKKDSLNLLNYAKAELLAEQHNFEEASKAFKKLADNKSLLLLNDISKYKYAQIEIAANKYENAVSALEELSNGTLKNVYSDKALYLLGNAYIYALKNKEKAAEAFQELLDIFPNSLYFDKSRYLLNKISEGFKQTI